MSSGRFLVAPDAVTVTAIAAAGAAVLLAGAANAAAEAGPRAATDYGCMLEQRARAYSRAEISALIWQAVAADIVDLNARIRMLSERVRHAAVDIAVPEPFELAGRTVAEADAWSVGTARRLAGVQEQLREAVAAAEWERVAEGLPLGVAVRPGAAEELAAFQQVLGRRATDKAPPAVKGVGEEEILGALDPDADERERVDVLRLAACVAHAGSRQASAHLRGLQAKVSCVNAAVARRRLAAKWLSALEDRIVSVVEPPEPFIDTVTKLRTVVAADQELTARLRAEGSEAVTWALDVARRHFLRDTMRVYLTGQGYAAEGESDAYKATELLLTRPEWKGEHSAEIWMDRHGAVHGRVVRTRRVEGDDAHIRERIRCADFDNTLKTLGRRLGTDVVTGDTYIPRYDIGLDQASEAAWAAPAEARQRGSW